MLNSLTFSKLSIFLYVFIFHYLGPVQICLLLFWFDLVWFYNYFCFINICTVFTLFPPPPTLHITPLKSRVSLSLIISYAHIHIHTCVYDLLSPCSMYMFSGIITWYKITNQGFILGKTKSPSLNSL